MKVFMAFLPWLNMKVVVRPEPKLPLTLQTENKAQPDFLTLLCDSLYKATCGNIGQMQRLVHPLKRHTAIPLMTDAQCELEPSKGWLYKMRKSRRNNFFFA